MVTASGATSAELAQTSSYRVKFKREEFLELVRMAKPKVIYLRKNRYFFAFDGFVMYTCECNPSDFSQRIIEAIEFSNQAWTK
jgi:hypothetical protein